MSAHHVRIPEHHTGNVTKLTRRCFHKKSRQFFGDTVGVVILPQTEKGGPFPVENWDDAIHVPNTSAYFPGPPNDPLRLSRRISLNRRQGRAESDQDIEL